MNTEYEKHLGKHIRFLRKKKKLTQEQLAARFQVAGCDITRSTIAKTEVGQVVEGINALPAACRLAKQYKVEMPIVQAVEAILDGKLEARSALMALMGRSLKRE